MIHVFHAYFDPWSLLCVSIITILSWLFYRTIHSFRDRLMAIGSLIQSLSILVSLIYAVGWLSSLPSFDILRLSGPYLSFVLTTMIYGIFVNVIIKVYVRVITLDDQYAIYR